MNDYDNLYTKGDIDRCNDTIDELTKDKQQQKERIDELEGYLTVSIKSAERRGKRIVELEAENKQLKRLVNQITHCEDCGSDWVDNGLNSGCRCLTIKDLRVTAQAAKELVDAIEANRYNIRLSASPTNAKDDLHLPSIQNQINALKELLPNKPPSKPQSPTCGEGCGADDCDDSWDDDDPFFDYDLYGVDDGS